MKSFQDRKIWDPDPVFVPDLVQKQSLIGIRFVPRGRIRIRSMSDRIQNPAYGFDSPSTLKPLDLFGLLIYTYINLENDLTQNDIHSSFDNLTQVFYLAINLVLGDYPASRRLCQGSHHLRGVAKTLSANQDSFFEIDSSISREGQREERERERKRERDLSS